MTVEQFDPIEYRVFECITGSKLYGTDTPDSDLDTRGVIIPPMEVMIDPFMRFEVKDGFDGEDRALYDLGKFMNLAADCNPNIVELLFVPDQLVLFKKDVWEKVVAHRHLFLSKNVKHRFLGYAISQLEAIKRHRQWFIDPPDREPTRAEYGLEQTPSVSMAWLHSMKQTMNYQLLRPEFVEEIRKEEAYRDAHRKWENYRMWQSKRNPKRRGTEEEYGYDTKYASHLFRLLSEGRELLLTGKITFPLPNAEWLLAIKNGLYDYDDILALAQDAESDFDRWYAESPLPDKPDRNALKSIYYDIVLRSRR